MKFPVDKCWDCGLDLTTAEPAEVTYPGNDMVLGSCPGCGKLYFMSEVTPQPSPEPVVEPEPPVARGGHRRVSEPEPEPAPEE